MYQKYQDLFSQQQSKDLFKFRNLQGEKYVIINEENEPKNVAIGLYDGLKGLIIFI